MKMKFILAALWAMALLMGCTMDANGGRNNSSHVDTWDTSKSTVKKSYKISNFTKIDAANGIQVVYTQGKFTGIAEVQMTPTAEKYLRVEVENGELNLSYHNFNENINGATIVKVQAPELTEIDLSSAASVTVNGNLKVNNKLEIDLSSASSVTVGDISAKTVEIDLSSASSVKTGNLNLSSLEIDLSSASSCTVGKVAAVTLDAEAANAAKCEIAGFNGTSIDSEASSTSELKISGITAQSIKAEASSGAKITLEGRCGSVNAENSSGAKVDVSRLSYDSGSVPSKKNNASSKKGKTQRKQPTPAKTMPREP